MKSKAQIARVVYRRLMRRKNQPARKVFIQAFIRECGLTPAGANTYLYNIDHEV